MMPFAGHPEPTTRHRPALFSLRGYLTSIPAWELSAFISYFRAACEDDKGFQMLSSTRHVHDRHPRPQQLKMIRLRIENSGSRVRSACRVVKIFQGPKGFRV